MANNDEQDMNSESEIDYTAIIIKDMYTILTTHKNYWPKNYTAKDKIKYLDKLLEHLAQNEMFEMCAGIKKIKKEIGDDAENVD